MRYDDRFEIFACTYFGMPLRGNEMVEIMYAGGNNNVMYLYIGNECGSWRVSRLCG